MNTYIYKESCADYFPKIPNVQECKNQIDSLTPSSFLEFPYVDEKKGVKLVGLLEKIWQMIRGFFGFTNYTNPVLVKSETLKLLHYGKFNGLLENEAVLKSIKNFKAAIESNQIKPGKSISTLVMDICDKSKILAIDDFRDKLTKYHEKHQADLRPGFWTRLFTSPPICKTSSTFFGNSHLQLAKQAEGLCLPSEEEEYIDIMNEESIDIMEQKNQAMNEVLKQYRFALSFEDDNLKNRISDQFREFLEIQSKSENNWTLISQDQKKQILHLIRTLSSSSHKSLDESIKSEECASLGLRCFADDLPLRVTKYVAQVKQKKYDEVYKNCESLEKHAEELELSLKCLDLEDKRSQKAHLSELKWIYETLGEVHSQYNPGWIWDRRDYSKASAYFYKAWQKDTADPAIEAKLFESLMSAAEKKSWWEYCKSKIGIPNQERKEFVKKACQYTSSIQIKDFQRIINLCEEQKQYDQAIYFYELGVKKSKDVILTILPDSYYQEGLIKQQRGKLTDALENFEKAVKLDPYHHLYQNQLFQLAKRIGNNYLENEEFLAARHYFYQALNWQTSETEKREVQNTIRDICISCAQEKINKCLVPLKDYDLFSKDWKKHKKTHKVHLAKALNWYNEAIDNDPTNGALYFDKAELMNYFEMKDKNYFEAYKLAVNHKPKNYFYLLRLSEIYNERNDQKNCLKYRELALKIRKGSTLDYLHWYDDRFQKNKIFNIDPHTF
jgi:hypothetical protein